MRSPCCLAERRNASGAIDGRGPDGLLLPRGAVAPHATCSGPPASWMPLYTALQMRAYAAGAAIFQIIRFISTLL